MLCGGALWERLNPGSGEQTGVRSSLTEGPGREVLTFKVTHRHHHPAPALLAAFSGQGLPLAWGRGLRPRSLRDGISVGSAWATKDEGSRKTCRLSVTTDSRLSLFPLAVFFQCHFKLQLPANQRAPCLLTSRSSQFPPAAESFSLSFFFKLKWRLVSCLKEYTAFPAEV